MGTYDLIVIGGGPAGATLATLAVRRGHGVLLLEREPPPRYQIGESLLPATIEDLAPLLGVAERFAAADFVVKRGATFCWGDRPEEPWRLTFGPEDIAAGRRAPAAYNVCRRDFDRILFENAAEQGVDVRSPCPVKAIGAPAEDGRREVLFQDPAGRPVRARARFVANASGQSRLRIEPIQPRTQSRFFRKVAVYGYFENGARLSAPREGDVLFETVGDAWLWYIPLTARLTSVGVVAPKAAARQIRADPRAALNAYIAGCPRTRAMLARARPAQEAPYESVRICADYSYCSERFWAPGVFHVGDAACFVDVLLSSGVHLATYGALLAARSVDAVLRGQIDEAHAMNEYESRLRQEYAVFYQGLTGLYDMGLSRETYSGWLRSLLQNTNGVVLEHAERNGAASGLNAHRLPAGAQENPAKRAAANVETMRRYIADQLAYDGAPRMIDVAELPAVRNTLVGSADRLAWTQAAPLPA